MPTTQVASPEILSDTPNLELSEIQGNILAGFNKDHQRFLFLSIHDAAAARQWLRSLLDTKQVNFTVEVKQFNDAFKAERKRKGQEVDMPTASWLNIAFNYPGLVLLEPAASNKFPDDFREGMSNRSSILGDRNGNSPEHWEPWSRKRDNLHVLVLLAADVRATVEAHAQDLVDSLPGSGMTLCHMEVGESPASAPANEHFGFRDGISQPGVRGFTVSTQQAPPRSTAQGIPGQDLLWPGEFVLGYPTQIPERPAGDWDGPNPDPGPVSQSGPSWTRNGSYLVFRKLAQDVAGFRNNIGTTAASLGLDPEVLGAKIVGRFRSGCPMEALSNPVAGSPSTEDGDPSKSDAALLADDHINDFEYGEDTAGEFVPRSGHVRKAYPRDEQFLDSSGKVDPHSTLQESDTQTHRVLRRGIPYGVEMPIPADGGLGDHFVDDGQQRGLLFLAYQKSIAGQFEFIQNAWVNNPDFPQAGDGVDPVMSQVSPAKLTCPFKPGAPPESVEMQHFVSTRGGEYFFQPSLSALRRIAHL